MGANDRHYVSASNVKPPNDLQSRIQARLQAERERKLKARNVTIGYLLVPDPQGKQAWHEMTMWKAFGWQAVFWNQARADHAKHPFLIAKTAEGVFVSEEVLMLLVVKPNEVAIQMQGRKLYPIRPHVKSRPVMLSMLELAAAKDKARVGTWRFFKTLMSWLAAMDGREWDGG